MKHFLLEEYRADIPAPLPSGGVVEPQVENVAGTPHASGADESSATSVEHWKTAPRGPTGLFDGDGTVPSTYSVATVSELLFDGDTACVDPLSSRASTRALVEKMSRVRVLISFSALGINGDTTRRQRGMASRNMHTNTSVSVHADALYDVSRRRMTRELLLLLLPKNAVAILPYRDVPDEIYRVFNRESRKTIFPSAASSAAAAAATQEDFGVQSVFRWRRHLRILTFPVYVAGVDLVSSQQSVRSSPTSAHDSQRHAYDDGDNNSHTSQLHDEDDGEHAVFALSPNVSHHKLFLRQRLLVERGAGSVLANVDGSANYSAVNVADNYEPTQLRFLRKVCIFRGMRRNGSEQRGVGAAEDEDREKSARESTEMKEKAKARGGQSRQPKRRIKRIVPPRVMCQRGKAKHASGLGSALRRGGQQPVGQFCYNSIWHAAGCGRSEAQTGQFYGASNADASNVLWWRSASARDLYEDSRIWAAGELKKHYVGCFVGINAIKDWHDASAFFAPEDDHLTHAQQLVSMPPRTAQVYRGQLVGGLLSSSVAPGGFELKDSSSQRYYDEVYYLSAEGLVGTLDLGTGSHAALRDDTRIDAELLVQQRGCDEVVDKDMHSAWEVYAEPDTGASAATSVEDFSSSSMMNDVHQRDDESALDDAVPAERSDPDNYDGTQQRFPVRVVSVANEHFLLTLKRHLADGLAYISAAGQRAARSDDDDDDEANIGTNLLSCPQKF